MRRKTSLSPSVSNRWAAIRARCITSSPRSGKETPNVFGWTDLKNGKRRTASSRSAEHSQRNFDKDKTRGLTLFPWIERFLQVKASKKSLKKDKVGAERIKTFFGDRPLDSILTSEIEAYKAKATDGNRTHSKGYRRNRHQPRTRLPAFHPHLAARDGILQKLPHIELYDENQRTVEGYQP